MLKINFYPESDLGDYKEATKFFEEFWMKDGEKITNKWEEISGFKFIENEINAIVGDLRSCSHPLSLRFNNSDLVKKANLVHELGHRIFYKRVKGMGKSSLNRHKMLFLGMIDVLLDIDMKDVLDSGIEFDKDMGSRSNQPHYEEAWNWALQYKTKEERQKVLKQIISGELEL